MKKSQNSKAPEAAAFLPVPVRARHDGWSPDRQREFVETLADTGSVREAAARVGMTEQSAYRLRRRAGAESFDIAWEAALERGLQRLASMAFERAVSGTVKRRFYHGELIDEEVVHSERLLIYLLDKGRLLLSRRAEREKAALGWDAWMERLEGEAAGGEGRYRVWQADDGVWLTNFPPPADFSGWSEQGPGAPDYARTLTDAEMKANARREAARAAAAADARERWFGSE